MTLAEAIAAFEADFTVSRAPTGFPDPTLPSRADPARAPTGERYADLTTAGWFADEEAAAAAWLREAWIYGERRGGKTLYWSQLPTWKPAEYLAIDQVAALNDPHLRHATVLRIGKIHSMLLVSKEDTGKAKAS